MRTGELVILGAALLVAVWIAVIAWLASRKRYRLEREDAERERQQQREWLLEQRLIREQREASAERMRAGHRPASPGGLPKPYRPSGSRSSSSPADRRTTLASESPPPALQPHDFNYWARSDSGSSSAFDGASGGGGYSSGVGSGSSDSGSISSYSDSSSSSSSSDSSSS